MLTALPKPRMLALVLGIFLIVPVSTFSQNNRIMGRLQFDAHGWVNKTAGVWVDRQYVGYVKELHGDRTVYLLPGAHSIQVREAGFHSLSENLAVSPGQTYAIAVDLQQIPQPYSADRAIVQTFVIPVRAAVFVDGMYTGYAGEFRGGGNGILLVPGKHKIVITLPGYQAFTTEVSLLPHQVFLLATRLVPGSVLQPDANLRTPPPSSNIQ